jgi:hypothetical protein
VADWLKRHLDRGFSNESFFPMNPVRFLPAVFLLAATAFPLRAVEVITSTNSYFNTNDTISLTLPSWASGWGSGGDGWNYVGSIVAGGASGIYLGNGWVLTAAHVSPLGAFTLDGNVYDLTGVSYSSFTNSRTGSSNADLTLFQITTTSTTGTNLSLPSLTLISNSPALSSTVVMIGYGGASGFGSESWGTNTIVAHSQKVAVNNSFESIDFLTPNSGTNYSTLVLGDSGGGDFVEVGSTWELAGLNEAIDASNSYFVQLSAYDSQIQAITAVPEPSTWTLLGLSVVALTSSFWRTQRKD